VTLLLTCVTDRFVVQASDRRLTDIDGNVVEEIANKATLVCQFATFAYTGLSRCSRIERTDELLLRCLATPDVRINRLLEILARTAGQSIRGLPLQVRPEKRREVRRTSFVGAGFLGTRRPEALGRRLVTDELHPFLAVVSNAQGLGEEWRPVADRDFTISLGFLPEDQSVLLHAAGQPLLQSIRTALQRDIRRSLARIHHPESLARLLARAVRAVAAENPAVGPNVMCTMVRRGDVGRQTTSVAVGGLVPLVPELQAEASYFRRPTGDDDPIQWIFSPADPTALVNYGPNYACSGIEIKGMIFGPTHLIQPGT
jgi:hypothetical protein